MFTVCPKCALTLVVTAADLRVAQGYVRCGRCSNVFNAIVGLSDDRQAKAARAAANAQRQAPAAATPPAPRPAPPAPPPPPPRTPPKQEPPVDDTATTGENEVIYAEPEPMDVLPETALEFNPTATDVSKVFIEPPATAKGNHTGTFETIVLSDDDAALPEDEIEDEAAPAPAEEPPEEDEYVDNDMRSLAAKIDAEAAASSQPARPSASAASRATAPPRFVSESERAPSVARAAAPEAFPAPPDEPAHPALKYVLPGAAVAALLLLATQAIHHYRHDLATDPRFNRTLTSLYGKLGVSLVPRWDLTSYEVRQLGASSGAGTKGQLLVRASLKNSATHPLPLPLLRVIVQDRYGNRIAARDVAPRAYAPGAVPEGAVLGAGQRLDAEMTFVDPGQQAVGFEIDACLPGPDNAIHCANDAAGTR
jgi:predicted Zn finger-like uncharacterized protein